MFALDRGFSETVTSLTGRLTQIWSAHQLSCHMQGSLSQKALRPSPGQRLQHCAVAELHGAAAASPPAAHAPAGSHLRSHNKQGALMFAVG